MPHVGVIECIWFDANQFNCEQQFTLDVDAQTATLTARGTQKSPPWPYIVMAACIVMAAKKETAQAPKGATALQRSRTRASEHGTQCRSRYTLFATKLLIHIPLCMKYSLLRYLVDTRKKTNR